MIRCFRLHRFECLIRIRFRQLALAEMKRSLLVIRLRWLMVVVHQQLGLLVVDQRLGKVNRQLIPELPGMMRHQLELEIRDKADQRRHLVEVHRIQIQLMVAAMDNQWCRQLRLGSRSQLAMDSCSHCQEPDWVGTMEPRRLESLPLLDNRRLAVQSSLGSLLGDFLHRQRQLHPVDRSCNRSEPVKITD